ncbi:MAG: hypothetical protein B7Z78_12660 [Rhodospirillales bacterium 20-60-12]|jgi:uncharacterized Zn-binding protein involved in type VI secretion|nr:MAG: hypothetical protein B7Z78_12660 [Rhodospirillales bacterium 20-60-12]
MSGGKPAARITDMHTCPATTGPVPHVGGAIMKGSPNVFIGGIPAARVSDMAVCVGPPNSIVTGAATVFINGLPAARMTDEMAHGGLIIGGLPTVLIGDGAAGPMGPLGAAGGGAGGAAEALTQAAALGKPFCAICHGS